MWQTLTGSQDATSLVEFDQTDLHLWRVATDRPLEEALPLVDVLDQAERKQANAFRRDVDRIL